MAKHFKYGLWELREDNIQIAPISQGQAGGGGHLHETQQNPLAHRHPWAAGLVLTSHPQPQEAGVITGVWTWKILGMYQQKGWRGQPEQRLPKAESIESSVHRGATNKAHQTHQSYVDRLREALLISTTHRIHPRLPYHTEDLPREGESKVLGL